MSRVLFLDPYHGPSHSTLSRAFRERSRHQVRLLTLPPRKWKWRMRGAALAFEPAIRALGAPPDVLVTTDMLNLPELLALARAFLPPRLPVITYFHENQITYPLPVLDERDLHFGLANIYSALASDLVIFNSAFHRREFLEAVPSVLKARPDRRPDGIAERIARRSRVLGVPVELVPVPPEGFREDHPPLVLWNHRWEQDKDPGAFFRVMHRLDGRGVEFGMLVLGQNFRERPGCFDEAERALAHRIVRWGYIPNREAYLREAARCRVVVSTARHEFYGLAVREAIGMGCWPLLPRRVVYPELVDGRAEHLYESEGDLVDRLEQLLSGPPRPVPAGLAASVCAASAEVISASLDAWVDELTG
ncbi:MAG TPA: DUF3524 domain-containing protein [Candidatus Polarisedimenticolia bacterium]|nr:DUF3524 domain-containing protein [Candidatus Polarisedimenticolia bacterium]